MSSGEAWKERRAHLADEQVRFVTSTALVDLIDNNIESLNLIIK